jgi:peptidoglycan/LPS O-acetylase OafA/YrhL
VRFDIQALRGLAVLLVLATHAKLGLTAGYLGVDVFFVISGYLITGMVDRSVEASRFGFRAFYFRRAKRLLPAAYTVFVLSAVVAPFLLTSAERSDFAIQCIGAVTFTANVILFKQTNYFAGLAVFKPLLHIWSLSIEEQYYLFLPALVFFTPKRFRAAGAAAILAISLVLCLWEVQVSPIDAFYLVPYRVWELAVGSLGALALDRPAALKDRIVRGLFWPSVLALFAVPAFPIDPLHHPGIDAVIVCVATLVVILRRHEAFSASLPVRAVAWVGDFSYSLYLVHWPILAFTSNVYLTGDFPVPLRWGCAAVAIALGYALYRFVEHPIRMADIRPGRKLVAATLTTSVLVAALPSILFALQGNKTNFAYARRLNYGLSKECDTTGPFVAHAACRTGEPPRLLVWGDSFAEHLMPGLQVSTSVGVEQATSSGCGPFLGLAPSGFGPPCLAFNASVMAFVESTPSIEVVVLASPFGSYLSGAPLLEGTAEAFKTVSPTPELAFQALKATVDRLHAAKKRVVLVKPPPGGIGFNIGACEERHMTGELTLGAPDKCEIDQRENESTHAPVFDLLSKVSAATGSPIFSFDDFLCSNGRCAPARDGILLYRDEGHLSVDGSRWIGEHFGIGDRLMNMAR